MIYKRITVPNLILFAGFFLSQTCLLYHLVQALDLSYSPWVEDSFFFACTFLQIVGFVCYVNQNQLKFYSHLFEFLLLPLFSINFIKEGNFDDKLVINSVRTTVFSFGWILTLIMIITEYTRYNEQESDCIMKVSTNLRVIRMVKHLLFIFFVGLQIILSKKAVYICMLTISTIQLYIFLKDFTFQNPFHEYLVMASVLGSVASWLDFIFYIENYSNYSYVGQFLFLVIAVLQPEIFQKALEFKYQVYGQKNIETRSIHQIIGFFVVMKEIILNQHRTFNYTVDFDNKIHFLLQKMVIKSKVKVQSIYQDQSVEKIDFLHQNQVLFLRLLQKRLKQSNQFIAYEFFLMTIVRKSLVFKNKALTVFYERQNDKKISTTNMFMKIQMDLLYFNLFQRIDTRKKNEHHHEKLVFCQDLHQLKQKIIDLCKHEVSIINLFQNSLNVPIQKYSEQLIHRFEYKKQIKEKIEELNKNEWHIYSGDFLYLCLLYKIIFQREVKVIEEKINKNFIIPLAFQNRKSKFQLQQKKNSCIVVFSPNQKGQILNQNELFSKMYGKSVRSGQKSRKYISDLFPSTKQRLTHQQLMEKAPQNENLQISDHSSYDCWVSRKISVKGSKYGQEDMLITVLQKAKIFTRIYYEIVQSHAFICIIDSAQNQFGIRVQKLQIEALKKNDIEFQSFGNQLVQQLNEQIEIHHILIKNWQDEFVEGKQSDQMTEINISENLIFTFKMDPSASKKILQIQKEYDKEQIKFNPRKLIIILAVFFPIIALSINIGLIVHQQIWIQKSTNILESEKIIFQKTILNEKFLGLHQVLLKLIDNGYIQTSMCTEYNIFDLRKFAVQNLRKYIQNNFDEIQKVQIKGTNADESLMNLVNKNLYKFLDLKDTSITMNYAKYSGFTKSVIFEYATTIQQKTLTTECQKSIKNLINTNEIKYNGLFSNLRKQFAQNFNILNDVLESSQILLMLINFGIFLAILFIFYNLILYKYKHILLLKDFKRAFVQGRVRQMDFIMNEILRLDKNEITDISINKHMNLSMIKRNQQRTIDLLEFQRESFIKISKNGNGSTKSISVISSSQLEEEKQCLIDSQMYEQKMQTSPIFIMMSFHKYKVLTLLVFFLTIGILNLIHEGVLKKKSINNYEIQDTFYEMGNLIVSMNDLLIGQINKYSGQQIFSTTAENQIRIATALNGIETNRFQEKVFSLFSTETSDFILYSSYCRNAQNLQNCLSVKAKALNNGLSAIVSIWPEDYDSTWNNKLTKDVKKIQQIEVCEKMVIFVNYTVNLFQQNLIVGYKGFQENLMKQQRQLKIAEAIVYLLMTLGVGIVAHIIVERGYMVRREVLSMDTKENLYQNQQKYRPYLNELYYREEGDDVQ